MFLKVFGGVLPHFFWMFLLLGLFLFPFYTPPPVWFLSSSNTSAEMRATICKASWNRVGHQDTWGQAGQRCFVPQRPPLTAWYHFLADLLLAVLCQCKHTQEQEVEGALNKTAMLQRPFLGFSSSPLPWPTTALQAVRIHAPVNEGSTTRAGKRFLWRELLPPPLSAEN